MLNISKNKRRDAPKRCAICDGPFGLIRHYSWRTPLCSKKCVEHLNSPPLGEPQVVMPSSADCCLARPCLEKPMRHFSLSELGTQ
jgi:hypothetical protein